VIQSFADEETERIFHRQRSRKLPIEIQAAALRKLRMLNNARTLQDLRIPPANRLAKLAADRAGQSSIRINEQWRICFIWGDQSVEQVEIVGNL